MHIKKLDRMGAGETTVGIVQTGFGLTSKESVETQTEDTAMLTASHRQAEDCNVS